MAFEPHLAIFPVCECDSKGVTMQIKLSCRQRIGCFLVSCCHHDNASGGSACGTIAWLYWACEPREASKALTSFQQKTLNITPGFNLKLGRFADRQIFCCRVCKTHQLLTASGAFPGFCIFTKAVWGPTFLFVCVFKWNYL